MTLNAWEKKRCPWRPHATNTRNWLISCPREIFSFLFILYIISTKSSWTEALEGKGANSLLTDLFYLLCLKNYKILSQRIIGVFMKRRSNAQKSLSLSFLKIHPFLIKFTLFIKLNDYVNISASSKNTNAKFISTNYYDRTIRLEAKTSGYLTLAAMVTNSSFRSISNISVGVNGGSKKAEIPRWEQETPRRNNSSIVKEYISILFFSLRS